MLKAPGEAETCWGTSSVGPALLQAAWESLGLSSNPFRTSQAPRSLWLEGKSPLPWILGLRVLSVTLMRTWGSLQKQPSQQELLEPTCALWIYKVEMAEKPRALRCLHAWGESHPRGSFGQGLLAV